MSQQYPTQQQAGNRTAAQVIGAVLREFLPEGEPVFETIQENVYHLTVGGCEYLIKWIADRSTYGQNELRIGRLLAKRTGIPAPRLLFEKKVQNGTIAGWEFINGHDLREQGREQLPAAFARLGQFHHTMRYDGDVFSPLTNARFNTIQELLAAETYRLSAPFTTRQREQCAAIIARLEVGYPTLIHGDMHPGNILFSTAAVWFVDWSYASFSLNLLDLDYIQSQPLPGTGALGGGELSWPVIRPYEAAAALHAYFRAAGLELIDPLQTHQAVMVWNLLRSYENCEKNGYRAELEKVRMQLLDLLSKA